MAEPAPTTTERRALLEALSDAVRANQRATDQMDEVAADLMGINRTDSKFLDVLSQHGRMTAGDVARELRLSTGAVTAAIDRLERAGYVHRVADPHDRRRVLVEATQKAHEKAWELFGPLVQASGPLLERYTDEQLELLIEFHRLGRQVQEHQAAVLRLRAQDA